MVAFVLLHALRNGLKEAQPLVHSGLGFLYTLQRRKPHDTGMVLLCSSSCHSTQELIPLASAYVQLAVVGAERCLLLAAQVAR